MRTLERQPDLLLADVLALCDDYETLAAKAERLDALLAAVEAETLHHDQVDYYGDPLPFTHSCACDLCAAFRAFREQVTA